MLGDLVMNISEEKYSSLEKLFDSRTAEFRRKGNLLFKNYYFLTKEIKDNLEYLINKLYILGSGIPIDEFFINDSFKGVVINYFKDAVSFSKASNFSIEEKIKACNDISRQLNDLHSYGMCFNDIQCDNLLIDKDGGHLIDFDSSTFVGSTEYSCRYRLIDTDGNDVLSSVNGDLYKALICYLSIFYNIDLEKTLKYNGFLSVSAVSDLFENTSIAELINDTTIDIFSNNKELLPNMEVFLPFISDEERVNYDINILKDKVKTLG